MNFLQTCVAAFFALSISSAQAQGVQTLRSFMGQHPALAGDFTQTTIGKAGQHSGSFALAKPAHFRWALKKPFEQLIVSDGKTLTQWDADLNQATIRSAAGLLASTPVALLLGGGAADKFFVLSDAGTEHGLQWVQATPKVADGQFKRIKLGFKDGLPSAMQIQDAFGGTTELQFKNIVTLPVPASQFGFVVPKGADVVKL